MNKMTIEQYLESILDGIVYNSRGNILETIYPMCKKHNLNPFKEIKTINKLASQSKLPGSEAFDEGYCIWLKSLGKLNEK